MMQQFDFISSSNAQHDAQNMGLNQTKHILDLDSSSPCHQRPDAHKTAVNLEQTKHMLAIDLSSPCDERRDAQEVALNLGQIKYMLEVSLNSPCDAKPDDQRKGLNLGQTRPEPQPGSHPPSMQQSVPPFDHLLTQESESLQLHKP